VDSGRIRLSQRLCRRYIGQKYPQLAMQGIVADMRVSVTAGQTISMPLPPDTLGMYIENGSDHSTTLLPMPKDATSTGPRPIPARTRIRRIGSGTCVRAPCLPQFPHAHVQPGGRNAREGCPVSLDRLPGSERHSRLHFHHPRDLQAGGRRRIRQTILGSSAMNPTTPAPYPGLPPCSTVPQAERLRPSALPTPVLHGQVDG